MAKCKALTITIPAKNQKAAVADIEKFIKKAAKDNGAEGTFKGNEKGGTYSVIKKTFGVKVYSLEGKYTVKGDDVTINNEVEQTAGMGPSCKDIEKDMVKAAKKFTK